MDSKPNIDPSLYKIDPETMKASCRSSSEESEESEEVSLETVTKEFDAMERIDFANEQHLAEVESMFPLWLPKQSDEADMDLFKAMSRYDSHNKSFVLGCFDNIPMELKLISCKWKLLGGVKWRTRAGTHPNSTPLVRIATDSELIYCIEGQKDGLAATLLGLDFIMIPYAGYRNPNPEKLQQEVTGRDLVFLVEDKAAYKCMSVLAQLLAKTANRVTLKQLNNKSNSKVDLSDYIQNFKTIKEVIDGLQN